VGKLRLFGYDWKIKKANLDGATFSWITKEIRIGEQTEEWYGQLFFHELLEMCLQENGNRYWGGSEADPVFIINHKEMNTVAKSLHACLVDNGLISEKKIKKLIEEK